jgi:hypothetical protein
MVPVVADGRVVALYHQLNPEKLRAVPHPVEAWPPRWPDGQLRGDPGVA